MRFRKASRRLMKHVCLRRMTATAKPRSHGVPLIEVAENGIPKFQLSA